MSNTSTKKFLVAVVVFLWSCMQMFAITQIDGDYADYGLSAEYDGYYVIATADDLEEFKTLTNSGYSDINAVVTADIILNTSVLDENGDLRSDYETAVTRKWTEGMSRFAYTYSGTFDGNSHTISGLFIKNTSASYIGLFDYVNGATIKNLTIVDSYIHGKSLVGGIVGSQSTSVETLTMSNCVVDACIISNSDYAGGIYGGYRENTVIEDCVNKGTVKAAGVYVGGIAASISGSITNCSNTGTVVGSASYVGGIVGYGGTVSYCYNAGSISGNQYVGGISGNGSTIQTSCNYGDVAGITYVGGIAGYTTSMSDVFNVGMITGNNGYVGGLAGYAKDISYAYNAGFVSNNSYLTNVGGLCGICIGTLTSCYYDSDKCPYNAVNNASYSGATANTTDQLCSGELPSGLSSSLWTAGSAVVSDDMSQIDDEFATQINGKYPRLQEITKVPYATVWYYNTGTASSPTWVQFTPIYSTVDLSSMDNSSGVFVLMNDIVEARNISDGNLLETPSVEWTPISLFEGQLYGRGKTISGLCTTSGSYGGLFATINNATVMGVNMAKCSFAGTSSVGAISAISKGVSTITNCNNYCDFDLSVTYLAGICGSMYSGSQLTVTNSNNYGNLVATGTCAGIVANGYNPINIIECVNYGSIEGNTAGGIFGDCAIMSGTKGSIQQCINYGAITSTTGSGSIGGISGHQNASSRIRYCLNRGNLVNTGSGATGGILGYEASGDVILQCLNLGAISSISTAGAICGHAGTLTSTYNYYNSDSCIYKAISNNDEGTSKGMTTAELIAGTLPTGFSSDYWSIRPAEVTDMKKYYYYPYITCYGEESAILAQVKDCHTVSFNFNGGSTTDEVITYYVETEEALLPATVTKDGCTFDGWYDNSNYTSSVYTEVPLTEKQPKNFYAKWIANNYTIEYVTNEGTINNGKVQFYTYGYGALLPTDVTREGYTFKGWYLEDDYSGEVQTSIATNEFGDRTYYAKWEAVVYTITYNANEGVLSEEPASTYSLGDEILLPTPTREGYTFDGWYNNSNLSGTEFTEITATETGNKEFWAKWIANSYAVTLNVNEGTINSGNVTGYIYGSTVILPSDVTKTGNTFGGWYESETFEGDAVSTIAASDLGDKTYYAKWTANVYDIILVVNEGTINAGMVESYTYGEGATLPTEVTKEGYSFGGWYSNSSYIGGSVSSIANNDSGDKQYWAKWTINEYEVSAEAENGTVEGTGSYEYKSTATLRAVADDAYEFVNWNTGSTDAKIQIVVTADTTVTATFKLKETIYPTGVLEIDTLKTEVQNEPIDLSALFASSEDGTITYTAMSSNPSVVAVEVVDDKLYLTTNQFKGSSEVSVIATLSNGNKATLKDDVVVEYNCDIQVESNITSASCYGEQDGSISLSAEMEYTYQWVGMDNTSTTVSGLAAGNYSVVVTDARGCRATETYTVSQPDEIIVSIDTVVNPRCGVESLIRLTAEGEYTYLWSDGSTEKDLSGAEVGDYTVTVTNPTTECSTILEQGLELTFKTPEISLVTVSRETGKNLVVWVRENTDQIDYYTIYRETTSAGEYDEIGTVKYTELSVFEDSEALPEDRQWSYTITATDYCGNETEMSRKHTTLHLNDMKSNRENKSELIWQPYEGIDYQSFYIIRETTVSDYTFIDTVTTVPSTITAYTPEIPSVGKSLFYVGIKLDKIVDPKEFLKAESGPFSLAISNIAEAENEEETGIETIETDVAVYAVGHTIVVEGAAGETVCLYDVNGQMLSRREDVSHREEISVKLDGVYLVIIGAHAYTVLIK